MIEQEQDWHAQARYPLSILLAPIPVTRRLDTLAVYVYHPRKSNSVPHILLLANLSILRESQLST